MVRNIFKIVKYISVILFFNSSFLFSECRVTLTENFFNDDIIGYYLSAIDIDTGESNLLLFDYQINFIDCDEYSLEELSIGFNIDINLPNHIDDQISIIEGTFRLNNININNEVYSISFRNTDLNSDTVNLPSGVEFSMNSSDYTIGITDNQIEELSDLILGLGRLPNGRYSFKFEVANCPDSINCDDAGLIKELNIFLPEYLSLLSPGSSDISDLLYNQVYIPYPIFQWNADYCSKCGNYLIRICEYNPDIHNSLEDAINSLSIIPTGIGFLDTGSQNNVFQYPVTGFEDLYPGNFYVWQVKRSFETTYGFEEELSDIFIFQMNNNENEQSNNNTELNEQNLDLILQFIGQSKFDELFVLDSGDLYNYNPTSTINIDGQEKSLDYLLELIELLNNSQIEIIEVDVE